MSMRLSVAGLLAGLVLSTPFALAAAPPAGAAAPCYRVSQRSAAEKGLERRLAMPVTLNFENTPLKRVLDDLLDCYGVNVMIDRPAMDEAGTSLDSPITVKLEQVSLRAALNLILRQVKMTYVIKDEVLHITTEKHATGKLVAVTYPVADLVVPIRNVIEFPSSPPQPGSSLPITASSFAPACKSDSGKTAQTKTLEEQLITLVTSTISPKLWADMGGPGTIDYFPLGMALVINQTPDVHEQIADLLAALRRLQDVEVSVEVRFLTVSDDCLAKLGLKGQEAGKSGSPGMSMLDDTQVRVLMEAVQSDTRCNVMQAPKVTCFNGQKANIESTEKQSFVTGVDVQTVDGKKVFRPKVQTLASGFRMSVLPTVSADQRTVNLQLGVSMTKMLTPKVPVFPVSVVVKPEEKGQAAGEQPQTFTQFIQQPRYSTLSVEKTLKIADGATALLSGWTQQREVCYEVSPPILGKIPYVSRLFKNVGYGRETENLLVMVTPRIIVRQEEEEKKPQPPTASAPPPCKEASQLKQAKALAADLAAELAQEQKTIESAERIQPVAATIPPEPARVKEPAVMHVNSRSFTLAYDVDNVGPSKLAGVTLWYTRDGKSWECYPEQVKPAPALPVRVDQDGRYGFTLVPKSGAGLSAAAPCPGDEPQVWVEVDTRKPSVELYSPEVHETSGGIAVTLRWCAEDAHLDARCVALYYAESAAGPWAMLARGLEAKGSHECAAAYLPGKCYLRVEATDRAGNVAAATTAEPVVIDCKVPTIRAIKVGP
jgi:type II secretory pathway component GspD/PulD (secretin)